MKKSILALSAVFAIAQSAFGAWSADGYVQKVRIAEGCGTNPGQTVLILTTNGSSYAISTAKVTYETTKETIQNAVASRSMIKVASNTNTLFQILNSSAVCGGQIYPEILGVEQTTGQ